jgi:TusA-related sulfurtransferase
MGGSVQREIRPVLELDVTSTRCPETWTQVLAALGGVAAGEAVHVVLSAGEQMEQVPAALKAEGHRIVGVLRDGRRYHLLVQRGGASAAADGRACCPGGACGGAAPKSDRGAIEHKAGEA